MGKISVGIGLLKTIVYHKLKMTKMEGIAFTSLFFFSSDDSSITTFWKGLKKLRKLFA